VKYYKLYFYYRWDSGELDLMVVKGGRFIHHGGRVCSFNIGKQGDDMVEIFHGRIRQTTS